MAYFQDKVPINKIKKLIKVYLEPFGSVVQELQTFSSRHISKVLMGKSEARREV